MQSLSRQQIALLTAWTRFKRTMAYGAIGAGVLALLDYIIQRRFELTWREALLIFLMAALGYYSKYQREAQKE